MTLVETTAQTSGMLPATPLQNQARIIATQWLQVRDQVEEKGPGTLPIHVRRALDTLADIIEMSQPRPLPVAATSRPMVARRILTSEGGSISVRRAGARKPVVSIENVKGREVAYVVLDDVGVSQLATAIRSLQS